MKRGVEGIFTEQFVLLIGQALHLGRQFALELPETLRREGLKCHSSALAMPRPALLIRMKLAGARICLHLLKESHARATRGEIALNLGIPFRLVPLGKPSYERRLLVLRQLFDGALDFCEIHEPILPPLNQAFFQRP
jgi:hypothetical protein